MATDVQGRLREMRRTRADAMLTQARRDAALAILDETGTVSAEEVEARVEQTYTPPSDEMLDNLVAQKTKAAVDHEREQLAKAEHAVTTAQFRLERAQDRVRDRERELGEAQAALDELLERVSDAEALSEAAGGDPSAAPPPSNVAVEAETAHSSASGG